MLPAFKGRINRKTFILGNIIGLGVLGVIAMIYVVPIAIIDLVINSLAKANASGFFRILYMLLIIPAIFWFFYFSVLFVKRMHDIGYPGMLILWAFIAVEVIGHLLNLPILNAFGFITLVGVALLPGQKVRNPHGPKPGKKFKLADLTIKF